MDESFKRMKSRRHIQNLAESIQSLTGFNPYITSRWAESVCQIIKGLPSDESSANSQTNGDSFETMESSEKEDVETSSSVENIQDELSDLSAHLNQLNAQRRQALNDFLNLKGNIRVFCRVRPILPADKCPQLGPVVVSDLSNVFLKFTENKEKHYNFDKVFHPKSSQDEVFSEVEPVIKSALDGYNICIFAYGQTGTGKTFTMEGRQDCPGVIPRALEALFKQAADGNHAFIFNFSMLEIYMGNLRDLLVPRSSKLTDPTTKCLLIKTDPAGEVEIDNLVSIRVNDFNQAKLLYRLGSRLRSTASTNSNITSSRSHCLIRISVTCFSAPDRRRETNKIWMVDLGGSERLLKTQATGRRLEEGKAINLSLSALGDVISALQTKKPHVPYRNSKLTQVLRDSLGGDSKTLMLVHISPKEEDLCETICSLGFAARVRSIHLGKEESEETQAAKELAKAELLQKMKHLEHLRQDIRRNIEKQNEKLRHLVGSDSLSHQHMEVPEVLNQELEFKTERKNCIDGNVTEGLSVKLPRFMRSTICSQRKSSVDHQYADNTKKKHPLPVRRKTSSLYAGSMTLSVKDISKSECGSEILGFNMKYSSDHETEFSHDASECDIKNIVFPGREKPLGGSVPSMSHISYEGINKSDRGHADKLDHVKCSNIDDWLHRQKNKLSGMHTHQSKRVLGIPLPKKMTGCNKPSSEIMIDKEEVPHRGSARISEIAHEKGQYNDFSELRSKIRTSKEEVPHHIGGRNSDIVHDKEHDNDFELKVLQNLDVIEPLSDTELVGQFLEQVPMDRAYCSKDHFQVKDRGWDLISPSDMVNNILSTDSNEEIHESEVVKEIQEYPVKTYDAEVQNIISVALEHAGKTEIFSSNEIMISNIHEGYLQSTCKLMDVGRGPYFARNMGMAHGKEHDCDFSGPSSKIIINKGKVPHNFGAREADMFHEKNDGKDFEQMQIDITKSPSDSFRVKGSWHNLVSPSDMVNNIFNQGRDQTNHEYDFLKEIHEDLVKTYEAEVLNKTSVEFEYAEKTILSDNETMMHENGEEDFRVPFQYIEDGKKHCLRLMSSRRALFMDMKDVPWKDSTTPVAKIQNRKRNAGICCLFGHTIQVLCASALLGLGIRSLGLGHDFFGGLIL